MCTYNSDNFVAPVAFLWNQVSSYQRSRRSSVDCNRYGHSLHGARFFKTRIRPCFVAFTDVVSASGFSLGPVFFLDGQCSYMWPSFSHIQHVDFDLRCFSSLFSPLDLFSENPSPVSLLGTRESSISRFTNERPRRIIDEA